MKFTTDSVDELGYVQEVKKGIKVTADDCMFAENIITDIKVFSFCNGEGKTSIFVELYMGHIRISTLVCNEVEITEDRILKFKRL